MTPENYRKAILDSEDRINEKLASDTRVLLCSLQSKNLTFEKNPGLVYYTGEYQRLVDAAKLQMAQEAELIEIQFYDELEDGPCT